MKQWQNKKRIAFIIIVLLAACFWWMYLTGDLVLFAEKIINETPEAKVNAYIQAITKNNKEQALSVWEFPGWWNSSFIGFDQLKERREKTTDDLLKAKINSNFTVTRIEWWNTCCVPSVTDDSNWANGARVYVQLTDFSNNKLFYIFDVFVLKGYRQPGLGNSVRHWTIRDIYSQDQEPLFWTREDGVL